MSLKTGPSPYVFQGNEKVSIIAEGPIAVFSVGEDGVPEDIVGSSLDGRLRFRTRGPFRGYVNIADGLHWSMDVTEMPDPFDKSDPVKVEIPDDAKIPETLEDKLKRFLMGMIVERYGKESVEHETMEDALDMDVDDDDAIPLSGYEVTEMTDVFPDIPEEAEAAPPVVEEEPAEKVSEPPASAME